MAKKEEISKAELYRKERKERIAKEAKKNAKRNAKIAKMKRTALKAVAVVVAAAAVVLTAVGFGAIQVIAVSGQIYADGRVFKSVARARVRVPVEDHRANSSPA